ncbi:hypothetical protein DUI87_18887 [Hirundo rustica rustica]|uniref:Uncharacterized protein n=1 Tax=Hirundo rustica rustica TaxID=333673 RepID=A0A3M0JZ60_HIRRU|nr:hypothetical protein DUI87_18887 [Hirundo rustica rustica]
MRDDWGSERDVEGKGDCLTQESFQLEKILSRVPLILACQETGIPLSSFHYVPPQVAEEDFLIFTYGTSSRFSLIMGLNLQIESLNSGEERRGEERRGEERRGEERRGEERRGEERRGEERRGEERRGEGGEERRGEERRGEERKVILRNYLKHL